MKKNIILIMNFTFILLFIFSCKNKTESKYIENQYKEFKINDVTKPLSDTLVFYKNDFISSVKILITGNITGNAVIEFENGSGRFTKIKLHNKVNIKYETDWYNSKIFFRYSPCAGILGDSLILTYIMQ